MISYISSFRRILFPLLVWGAALIVLCACSKPAEVEVVEVEPPQAPDEIVGVVVNASPDDIALTRADMPAGFELAAEQSSGHEYVALYLRPSALDPGASGGNTLLSVLSSVAVYTTTAYAEKAYLDASKDPTEQPIADIELISEEATDFVIQPFEGTVQGADASEAFWVTYRVMEQPIFEYGHRLRLGNVLAYVVVTAIGNPHEPEHLLEDARDLVQRQIDHIAAAAPQTAPE